MSLPVFAINLDRSRSRWERLRTSAEAQGIALTRVPAVDGKAIPPGERTGVSEREFTRLSGRVMRPGEYGCYRSHLKAMEALVASGAPAGIVVEDDVEFGERFMERAEALLEALPRGGVVKLLNHRTRGFREKAVSRLGDRIGRCIHGPQGSAACYLVTADAARRLLVGLVPMVLPYDTALERGWQTGVETYTVARDLARLGPNISGSEIATRAEYRAGKLPGWKRLPTHLFRARDYAARILYASRGRAT